ncbi:REJ domain protein [Ichthyophthirius multifiliis]|uniref:REJ domain protein n=1 Tax=Ichthyophthirius multifiliis TaxID=5932 RepID=G0QIP2_ICHMU|nr:REJ domain protein [Ichthyophthirius multifiliis]EGR34912.1 REJ domain protein [Ichthyophthirius multifiliis]|eukprot:XP_004040216.1 REJ domain protein [Ichthyophthirius multifiliis]
MSSISNHGNKELKQITWSLISSNAYTADEIAQINTQIQQQNNQLFLQLQPLQLKKQGQYQFQVDVISYFNQIGTANIIIQTLPDTSIYIRVKTNPNQIQRSNLVNINVYFNLYQCQDDGETSYKQTDAYQVQIKQKDNLTEQLNINSTQILQEKQFQFQIQPFIMKVNTTYNIQITVSLKSNPTITEQIVFPIQVLSDVHSVQILGGNRQQQFSQSFNLEGKVDDPNLSPNEKISLKETNYGINLKWQCINLIIGDDCRDSQNNLIISNVTQNLQITIQQKMLEPFQQYQFILSGTKDGITIFDQIIISIIDYEVPFVQSNISINNSQNRINLNQEIFIQFDFEQVINIDNLIITGFIFYQNYKKNIIILGQNQFILQVWELFFDFLDEKQNQFELKFSIRNINYVVPTLISYTLYANIPPQQCIFDQTTDYKVRNLQDKITLQINDVLIPINLYLILSIFIKIKNNMIMKY